MQFRRFTPLFTIAFSCLAISASADVKSEIQTVYDKLGKAFMSKNVDGILALCTPDFTHKQPNGRVSAGPAMAAQLKQQFATGMIIIDWKSKLLEVKTKGNTATVKSNDQAKMQMKEPDGKTHTYAVNSSAIDTLVKTREGWKFKTVHVLKERMTRDGKPMGPMAPPPSKKKN